MFWDSWLGTSPSGRLKYASARHFFGIGFRMQRLPVARLSDFVKSLYPLPHRAHGFCLAHLEFQVLVASLPRPITNRKRKATDCLFQTLSTCVDSILQTAQRTIFASTIEARAPFLSVVEPSQRDAKWKLAEKCATKCLIFRS